jgi:hypothetical protein
MDALKNAMDNFVRTSHFFLECASGSKLRTPKECAHSLLKAQEHIFTIPSIVNLDIRVSAAWCFYICATPDVVSPSEPQIPRSRSV